MSCVFAAKNLSKGLKRFLKRKSKDGSLTTWHYSIRFHKKWVNYVFLLYQYCKLIKLSKQLSIRNPFNRQFGWIVISFLALGLPFGVKETLGKTSLAITMCGYIMFASWFIFAFKGFLFTFDDLNGSLINIKEAIEDLPDQDSPHVKKLRRMYERTPLISGCGMFGVER